MGLGKLVDKMKSHLIAAITPADDAISAGKSPSKKEIYRTRFNFGPCFGGLFVLEQWLFPSLFPDGTHTELQAVEKNLKDKGKDEAQKILESHWTSYATDDDWKWLQSHGVTGIRIPIGYWNIDGGKYTKGTKFEKAAPVYANSWDIFKKHFIEPAAAHNIGVLVDVHGLPFGANGNDHSGESADGKAGFWSNSSAQNLVLDGLKFIAKDLQGYENISGIQVVNESEFSESATKQKAYYANAINVIRSVDKTVPVIISDGWWPDQWNKWVQENQKNGNIGVVIDEHLYRCFDPRDKAKSAEQITHDLNGDFLTNLNDNGEGVDFMCGEWSCVLDGDTWAKSGLDPNDYGNDQRAKEVAKFGATEEALIFQRAGGGSYFWTFKFESGNGGEWDFHQQLDKSFKAPKVGVPDENKFKDLLHSNLSGHENYWKEQNAKEKYQFDRYKDGFTTGWNVSVEFAKQGSLLGRRQAIRSVFRNAYIKSKGDLPFQWEWDQGYDKGAEEFLNAL